MPPAVALLNYISCGILWRSFCHSGIFRGVSSSHIKIKIKSKNPSESIPGLLKRLQIWALVEKGHKNTNAPLIFENLGHYFFVLGKLLNGPFLGIFRGGLDFFDP